MYPQSLFAAGLAGCRRSLPCHFQGRITTQAILLVTVVVPQIISSPPLSAGEGSRPNIVFIMADDLGWRDVAFHGGNVATPNLDRLAAASVELTQHYVAPVCTPTRVGLLTGRYWSRFGITTPRNERCLPWDTVTLPKALSDAGYDTCLIGKWHLGSLPEWGPNHFGFQHSYGSLAGGVNALGHYYKKGPYSRTWHRNEELTVEKGHVTDLLTAEAVKWISERGERPFFLYVPFTAVHLPVDEPQEWLDRVPKEIQGEVPRHYAACIMHMDDSVQKILVALRDAGFAENTMVVFTSDNGGSTAENNDTRYPFNTYPAGRLTGNNFPLRGKKGDVYEGGIRVPTLVHWPGKLSPGKLSSPMHICDWMPTFCHLAEYKPAADLHWDGQDVGPTIAGIGKLEPRPLYCAGTNFRSAALRDGDWKLVVRGKGDKASRELFNLADDPEEKRNLAAEMPDRVTSLTKKLSAAARNDGDVKVSE